VGCPSPRVQKGSFGACLMKEPDLVKECMEAMAKAVTIKCTVKCRLGVDNFDNYEFLKNFVDHIS
jgi:tRNA-dihydrouridine synthase A